jgi:oxalate decarboxylase
MFSRRDVLAVSAAGAVVTASAARAATFGNPDLPPQGAINAKAPGNLRDPGPQSEAVAKQFPSAQSPPATDVGSIPMDWASFNNAPKRLQNGGWARQVTQKDFAISDTISGVNMRLTAGGIRELHWHQAAEWAIMTYGSCRVTLLDAEGRPYVADVNEGDLWYFPAGQPHSLQGLGPDGCEFVICFDDGDASEFNRLLVTDWFAHTPPEVLAKNFGVPAAAFSKIPPAKESKSGALRVADSRNFNVSRTVAAALVTVRPGSVREMHWHPNADEWQYHIKGKGRMTVFNTGPNAMTTDFNAGDIGYVKKNLGHYVENTGDADLQFIGVFRAPRYEEVSLSNWLTHTPAALVAQHLNVDESTIAKCPITAQASCPKPRSRSQGRWTRSRTSELAWPRTRS